MSPIHLTADNKACRTCAQHRNIIEMQPIFEDDTSPTLPQEVFSSNRYLAEFLFDHLQIKSDDGLPQHICFECRDIIETLKRFYLQCENARDVLEKEFKAFIKSDIPAEIEFMCVEKCEFDAENKPNEDLSDDDDDGNEQGDGTVPNDTESDTDAEDEMTLRDGTDCKICGVHFKSERGVKMHLASCIKRHDKKAPEIVEYKQEEFHPATETIKLSQSSDSDDDHEIKTRFECSICDKSFRMKTTLNLHVKRIHGLRKTISSKSKISRAPKKRTIRQKFQCDLCQKGFNKKMALKAHKLHDHPDTPKSADFKCDICHEGFSTNNYLFKHKLRAHKVGKHRCSECDEIFNSDYKYKLHLSQNHKSSRETNECKYCLQSFSETKELDEHEKTHTGSKPYLCTICGTRVSSRSNLKSHSRIHTGEKKYRCGICEKHFLHRSTYRIHLQEHTGYKPFQCEHCGKYFAQKSGLNVHLRTHTGDTPYKCDICGTSLSSKTRLTYHKLVIHNIVINEDNLNTPVQKLDLPTPVFVQKLTVPSSLATNSTNPALPYVCTVCNKGFKLPFKLTKHFKMHMDVNRPYSCTHCEKSFRHLLVLQKHIEGVHLKIKPFVCHLCAKSFTQKSTLTTHMITHTGAKPHTCTYCNKSFGILKTMRNHMRIHTGETPYGCDICADKFRTLKALATHQKTKHTNYTACSVNELQEHSINAGSSNDANSSTALSFSS